MSPALDFHDSHAVAAFIHRVATGPLPWVPPHALPVGTRFLRIYGAEHKNPKGAGLGSSRFSDPRFGRGLSDVFTALYAGRTLRTAFEEVVLRDVSDDDAYAYVVRRGELDAWNVVTLEIARPLRLVDLTDSRRWRPLHMPTDTVRASDHRLAQYYALGFHFHRPKPDGILYPSRFSGELNLMLYGHAIEDGVRVADGPELLSRLDLDDLFSELGLSYDDEKSCGEDEASLGDGMAPDPEDDGDVMPTEPPPSA